MTIRRASAYALSVTGLLVLIACSNEAGPSSPPVASTTITITSGGVSPKNVLVSLGQRVLFVNNDGRSHNMTSDPHPDHGDCPELNQVGFLSAGQSRETGNLVVARVCGFHDHDIPGSANLQGTITIR